MDVMRRLGGIFALLLALLSLVAPRSAVAGGGGGGGRAPADRYVVAAGDLAARLAGGSVGRPVVLSARSAAEQSLPGFVEGARLVDVDAWTAASETPGSFDDLAGWSARIGALGIDGASEVIVYDDGELKFAARIRFLLAHFGVRNASIVNGGYAGIRPLIDAGAIRPADGPAAPTQSRFVARPVQEPVRLVDRDEVAAWLGDPEVAIVDVRTPAEFDGRLTLPGDARPGHIPGARNLPVEHLFDPADPHLLQAPTALRSTFEAFGLGPDRPVVVYCHDGAKSSLAALALVEAGFTRVTLYYLSYRDWSEDPSLPVEE